MNDAPDEWRLGWPDAPNVPWVPETSPKSDPPLRIIAVPDLSMFAQANYQPGDEARRQRAKLDGFVAAHAGLPKESNPHPVGSEEFQAWDLWWGRGTAQKTAQKYVEGVYFIQAIDGGPIKIGKSISPGRRLAGLQTSHHERLAILATTNGLSEDVLHRRFAELKIRGEWYRAEEPLVGFIRSIGGKPHASRARVARIIRRGLSRNVPEQLPLPMPWG